MPWKEFIWQFSAADVARWLDAPIRTVYDWRNGAEPPAYLQKMIREKIERAAKKVRG